MPCRTFRLAATLSLIVLTAATVGNTLASEEGEIHYLLGLTGFQAGLIPPEPGTYFKNQAYYYQGKADIMLRGGKVALDVKQSEFFEILNLTHVTKIKVAEGDVALTAILPFVNANVDASVGPFFHQQNAGGFSDLCLIPSIGWHKETCHWFLGAEIYFPTGHFQRFAYAYTGLGYWTFGPNAGFTYLDPEKGYEISLFGGLDFNTKHAATDYQSGDILHLDFLAAKHFKSGLALALAGFFFDQVTGDSGRGAILGDFQGQAVALGPAVQYVKKLCRTEISLDFKYQREFDVRNTFKGNLFLFDLGFKF